MKKHFFYAAMAIAAMSSCQNNDEPANPGNENNDDRVAIELGVDAPAVTAITRGTGSVGDVDGPDNKWNSQRLYVYMFDQTTGEEATDDDGKIFDNTDGTGLEFRAPKKADGNGTIRIYTNSSYDAEEDQGTIQYKYYPAQHNFTFYGYHIDDATGGTPTMSSAEKTVKGLTIDGTQDLLAAKTVEMPETQPATAAEGSYDKVTLGDLSSQWATLRAKSFSAATARANIKPILKFKHQLARVKFFVRAGSEEAAGKKYDDETSSWQDRMLDGQTAGIQITNITLKDMINKVDMNIAECTTTAVEPETNKGPFTVRTAAAAGVDKKVESSLTTPIVPLYPHGDAHLATEPEKEGTPVGVPVMFYPNGDISILLSLKQHVIDTETEGGSPSYTYKDLTRTDVPLTIKEANIVTEGGTTAFEVGKSYNVYITVYSFERIEVTAELTAWEKGGDINADIEAGE